MAMTMIKMIMITMPSTSRVPQLTCIWMSLPGASGLGNQTTFKSQQRQMVSDKDRTWVQKAFIVHF